MFFIKFVFIIGLYLLPTVTLSASSIYKDCGDASTSDDICRYDGNGKYSGHYSIDSYKGNDEYRAYFWPSRDFAVILNKSDKTKISIDVSPNGLVGRNMKEGEYYPTNKNYNNTLPEIRAIFLGNPQWRRKAIQRNLKRLELYNSTIDGLWGRNTFNAIIGYNAVFEQSLYLGSRWAADQLLNKINNHGRFNYKNGKLKQSTSSNSWQTCYMNHKGSLSKCYANNVCNWATLDNPKRWNNIAPIAKKWVVEAKRRNLSCGVVEVNKPCSYSNPSNCSDATVCTYATIGIPKRWSSVNQNGKRAVAEAKKRNLTCGVEEQIASAPPAKTCSNDPKKCGAVELCQKAVALQNGTRIWKTDSYGKQYVEAAKSIGLTCNVDEENPQKTYRVANGTGFYVSDNGDIVTNQHVIDGCNEVQIHSNGEMAPASLISQDRINDLALLRTKLKSQSVFNLAPENPYLLQDIIAAGFPFGESISSTIKVTKGVVSSLSGLGDNSGQIQIDAALQPGNSGGPIIDENGNVVGVAVAKLDLEKSIESFGVVPENVNFGIKLSSLKTFLDDNNVAYTVGKEREIKNSELGNLATEATVLLSCWMTEARIGTMQNQKAMFEDISK